MDTVKVICENTGKSLFVEMGKNLQDVLNMLSLNNSQPFLAAYVNNTLWELGYRVFSPVSIRFIDITHFEGMRVYQRTLFFVLNKAVVDLFPGHALKIKHSVAKGFYCEIEGMENLPAEAVERIKVRMQELIAQNIPIVGQRMLREEAEELYRQFGFSDKISLMETRPHLYVMVDTLADLPGFFYGALAPSTGFIHLFDVRKYFDGFYLAIPQRTDPTQLEKMIPQTKMFDIFHEYKDWVDILSVSTIGALNEKIIGGKASELIKIAESFHEKKLGNIADTIHEKHHKDGVKLILVSGPSSSGKTTFSMRLDIQLRILGLQPVMVSLDNYFVDRDKTPLDEAGEHDYEALEALDLSKFNADLIELLGGKEVSMPRYDFIQGACVPNSFRLQLNERSVLIVEGIHALNPELTASVDAAHKFGIYISALTTLSMDNTTRISTTDTRLIRRMVRDNRFRNNNATATIRRWQSVRRGEDKHIFPYQEQADVMFNSALFYELSVLKNYAEPLLHEVPDIVPEYGEARRLLSFLDHFIPVSDQELPPTSILREFVGGSSFAYE